MWQTHPRTKGSTGYPDAVRDKDFFQSDRFLGGSFQSLPVDLSEKRLCEERCFGLLDDMNNWAGPKYMLAEGDTYMKYPDDETFPQLMVNYVKLDRVPKFKDGWTPVVDALRAGDYFVTSGEVLFRNWRIEGARREADVHGGSGMDVSAGIRGAGMERRQKRRPAGDQPDGHGAIRQPQIPRAVRRDRQEVGAIRSVGFGRQRRIHPAGPPEIAIKTSDADQTAYGAGRSVWW